MNLSKVLLAFLAARYPAAYPDTAVLQRVNASGLLDKPATIEEVRTALRMMVNRFKFLDSQLDTVSGAIYWTATAEGVQRWHYDGATAVA